MIKIIRLTYLPPGGPKQHGVQGLRRQNAQRDLYINEL
jgi:hypothetical protein